MGAELIDQVTSSHPMQVRASLEVRPSLSKLRSIKWDNSNKVCRACVKVVI